MLLDNLISVRCIISLNFMKKIQNLYLICNADFANEINDFCFGLNFEETHLVLNY